MSTPPQHDPYPPPGLPVQYWPQPPPPGKQPYTTAAKVGVVAGVLGFAAMVVLAVLVFVQAGGTFATPEVGDCVRVLVDDLEHGEITDVACSDELALYRVQDKHEGYRGGCGGDYAPFTAGEPGEELQLTLCMELNVADGECLTGFEDRTSTRKVGCGRPEAKMQATVHERLAEQLLCLPGDDAFVYPGPPARTVCLGELRLTSI
ncbi:LppU/SCO3897 family protein [Amycolatopsis nigrescens]|uniref:LppU/SCO3897 family protein n=1 Tax=Amycolatopsis nigrescens TaxID=381445 RepID=UPI0003A33C33|nr:hypothetical protein [Amycolatopsis nigrescens]